MSGLSRKQSLIARTAVLCVVIAAIGLAGCGESGPASGSAFARLYNVAIGAKAIRPGTELGLLYVYLQNDSGKPLTVTSVGINGPGMGTVVRAVQIDIGPLTYGGSDITPLYDSVSGSIYGEDPPVNFAGSECHAQILKPVAGYQMSPNARARIWIVLKALRPGRWTIPAHVVFYSQAGASYRQVLRLRAYGSVADDATQPSLSWGEQKCLRQTGARLLSKWAPFIVPPQKR